MKKIDKKKSSGIASSKPSISTGTETSDKTTTKRNRAAVLFATTPAKLAALVGENTTVLVSRKQLTALLQKDATSKALADLEA